MSLPSEYTRLEYIESTGTQYIDTGYHLNSNNEKIEMEFRYTGSFSGKTLIGTQDSAYSAATKYSINIYQNTLYVGASHNVAKLGITVGTDYECTIIANGSNGSVVENGGSAKNFAITGELDHADNILIFCGDIAGTPNLDQAAAARLYYCKIYDNGMLVRDFIPCKNASGVAGLWDDVNSQFYQNAGTGSFIAGEMPKGTHKTIVNGTAYEVKGGKCLVNGTSYDIKKGRTLINGTGYDITFAPSYDPVFANNTWEQIIAACHNNEVPDTWKVADHKPMTINGVDYQIDIIGKNHDDYSDGSGKAPLTLQLHDCYGASYRMNVSGLNIGGWTSCDMRQKHLPFTLAKMPTEVQNGIREVNKLTSAGNDSSTINTTADKLFLLSESEIFGSVEYSYSGEGTQYAYYKVGNSKVKNRNGSASGWWERSPKYNSTDSFCSVSAGGYDGYTDAFDENGVSFAFCF